MRDLASITIIIITPDLRLYVLKGYKLLQTPVRNFVKSHEATSRHSPTPKVQLLMAPELKEQSISPSVKSQSPTPKL